MLKAGLLGYPIGHSLSPALHNTAYRELGLDWEYALYPCPDSAAFAQTVRDAQRQPGQWLGFNVTTPYKPDAFAIASEHSYYDAIISGANVLSFSAGCPAVYGDNTDGRGLVAALKRQLGITLGGAEVMLCGTGAVALSVLLSLVNEQAAAVTVLSRSSESSRQRIQEFVERLHGTALPAIELLSYDELRNAVAAGRHQNADILIDATPVGMAATESLLVPAELLHPDMAVVDVVYGHGETALAKAAGQAGASAIDGLGMLVEQAALTIEIWAREQGLSLEVPRDAMYQAAGWQPH